MTRGIKTRPDSTAAWFPSNAAKTLASSNPQPKKSDYVPVPFQAVLMTNTNTRAMHVVLALPALWSAPCAQFKHTTKPIRTRLAGHRATEVGRRGEGICPRLTGPANPLVIASGSVGVRIIVATEDSSVVVARIRPGHQSRLVGNSECSLSQSSGAV